MSKQKRPSRKIRMVFSTVLQNWSVLLCFEMLYKGIGVLLFFPFLQYVFSRLPNLAGENYLGQENILKILSQPFLVLLLIGIFFLSGFFIYFEITALIIYSEKGWKRERITVWELWRETFIKTITLLHPKRLFIFLFLPIIMFSFFSFISGYLKMVQIPEFILEYIGENPLLFALFILIIFLFHLFIFFYLFGFPSLLLKGTSFLNSWRESLNLLKGRKKQTIITVLTYMFAFLAVVFVATMIGICFLALAARFFFGAEEGQAEFRLYFLSWEWAWHITVGTLLSVFLCAVIIVLFHQYQGDTQPVAGKMPWTLKRLFKRAVTIICTIAALFIFSESEISGRVWYPVSSFPKIVAHRAGAFFAPENTMAALKQAVKDKAYMAEIDVQQLKDGTLIIMHDTNFKRTTGVNLPVWEASYEDVKGLDAGSFFSSEFIDEPIPTLEEMLQAAKGHIRLMIELKTTGYEHNLEEETLALIKAYDMQKECVIASMNLDVLKRVKELDPEIQTVYISVLLLSEQYDLEYLDAYSVETTFLSDKLVTQAHFQGKKVYVWTANSEKNIKRVLHSQADGIITDNPQLSEYYLETMGENLLLQFLCDIFFPEQLQVNKI